MNVYFRNVLFVSSLFLCEQVKSVYLGNAYVNLCPNCFPYSSPNLPPLCPPEQPYTPAIDPVSIALALQAQKECIREEKLNFGPNKLPLDGRLIKCPRNILEDGLYSLNKQIVELKPCCPRKSLAEEAAESYLDDDCCDIDACNKPVLTYSDLGYVPETPMCPQFVPGAPPPNSYPQGQVIYNGPMPCQPPPSQTPPATPQCASVYQPGGLYLTQIGCRNAACSPECCYQNQQSSCGSQCCC